MNLQNYVNIIVPALIGYLFFKDKIHEFVGKLFQKGSEIGLPVNNDLSEQQHHFKRACTYDSEPINAALAVAKNLPDTERADFVQNTVPALFKRVLEENPNGQE